MEWRTPERKRRRFHQTAGDSSIGALDNRSLRCIPEKLRAEESERGKNLTLRLKR